MDAGPVTRALGLQVRGLPVQLLGGEKRAGGHPPALAWRPGPLHCLAPTAHSACLLSRLPCTEAVYPLILSSGVLQRIPRRG